MAERYEVAITVLSQKGTCAQELKPGDRWVISRKTPGDMCLSAFDVLYPYVRVMMFGGSFPWEPDPDVTTVACPDAKNPVVFEVRRLRK